MTTWDVNFLITWLSDKVHGLFDVKTKVFVKRSQMD